MAIYLKSLPQEAPASASSPGRDIDGAKYEARCAQCHGKNGEVPGAYSALAGNRAVLMQNTANLVQVILHGDLRRQRRAIRGRSACHLTSWCSMTNRWPLC
jgi:mono/diheme cytochrome c family protein